MTKIKRADVTVVSILTCIWMIHLGLADERAANANILSNISNNGRKNNPLPDKLQPSWSCILLGEKGCQATCSLMASLYGCKTSSVCRKGIYCECNEVYNFQQREVPATDFKNLSLDELWYYRFENTPQSKTLLNQLANNENTREYLSSLLRDPHITGDDVKYLLTDEYPQFERQLEMLVVNPHGLKSELAINDELEYNNVGEYFGDLFQWIKDTINEKIESCRSKRRILQLIRNINNEEDLQYILRQILLSGDDKLYNFVSSYLRRNGYSFDEENLCKPRRKFGHRRRGCKKSKRGKKSKGGCMGTDFDDDSSSSCAWHGRPLKKKVIVIHNQTPLRLDADEDEIIEIALINELKNDEETAKPNKHQQETTAYRLPNMKSTGQEISTSGPVPENMSTQGNTNLYSTSLPEAELVSVPAQGNTSKPETTEPQIPVLPNLQEYSSLSSPIKSTSSPSLTTPIQNIFKQESAPPTAYTIQMPSVQREEILMSPAQMIPTPLKPDTYHIQDAVIPVLATNTAPMKHQLEAISTSPSQMTATFEYSFPMQESVSNFMNYSEYEPVTQVPMITSIVDTVVPQMKSASLQLPISAAQNNNYVQEVMAAVPTMSAAQSFMQQLENTLSSKIPDINSDMLHNVIPYNDESPQFTDQIDNIKQSIESYIPNTETSQKYLSSLAPNLEELGNAAYSLPVPSTTTFYTVQSNETKPQTMSQNSITPQAVYEYVTSTPNTPLMEYDSGKRVTSSISSVDTDLENRISSGISSINADLENITASAMPAQNYDLESPSNMAHQVSSQYKNAMANFPTSSSLTSYLNQSGLLQNSDGSLRTDSLSTSSMDWMNSIPSASTISNSMTNMVHMPSWFTSNVSNTPQNDKIPSTAANSELNRVEENLDNLWESNAVSQGSELLGTQTTNKSFLTEEIPQVIQQSTPSLLGNLNQMGYESSVNEIQNAFETTRNGQNIQMADLAANNIMQADEMFHPTQITGSGKVLTQSGVSQPERGKRKKSLFYLIIDDNGNVVHSANVDTEQMAETNAATESVWKIPYLPNYFSQPLRSGNVEENYG